MTCPGRSEPTASEMLAAFLYAATHHWIWGSVPDGASVEPSEFAWQVLADLQHAQGHVCRTCYRSMS